MPVTPNRNYPYPALDTPANVPLDIQALAQALDIDVDTVRAIAIAARDAIESASIGAIANTLVKRNPTGTFNIPSPQYDGNPTPRGWVNDLTAAARAHAAAATTDLRGEGRTLRTGAGGAFAIADPTAASHPATKGYVDGAYWGIRTALPVVQADNNTTMTINLPTGRFNNGSLPIVVASTQDNSPTWRAHIQVLYVTASAVTIRVFNDGPYAISDTARLNLIAIRND